MIPIKLRSVGNIRDLGGTRMKDGSVIRCGCLIRSAHLGYAAKADVQLLQEKYLLQGMLGFAAHERIDGKLIRPEAAKTLKITA